MEQVVLRASTQVSPTCSPLCSSTCIDRLITSLDHQQLGDSGSGLLLEKTHDAPRRARSCPTESAGPVSTQPSWEAFRLCRTEPDCPYCLCLSPHGTVGGYQIAGSLHNSDSTNHPSEPAGPNKSKSALTIAPSPRPHYHARTPAKTRSVKLGRLSQKALSLRERVRACPGPDPGVRATSLPP